MKQDNLPKILISPLQDDGCSWYRLRLYKEAAMRNGLANVEVLDPNMEDRTLAEVLKAADAFVFRFYSERVISIMDQFKMRFPDKAVILDTDDDVDSLSPINNSYDKFGTQEVKLPDGSYLWKHGQKGFDMYNNRHRLIDYEYALEQSDAVITTTVRLSNKLKEHNPVTAVIPNALDFRYVPEIKMVKDKNIRLLWSGGSSHYEDLYMIKDALKELMVKYPQLIFVVAGQSFPGIVKDLPEGRFEYWPWTKADGHGYRLACTNADIGIAPLRDMDFNYYKSCVKWYEYSALGIPTVASKVAPYSDEIKDNLNGLLFSSPDEFKAKVSELIDDPIKRSLIASNANKWVHENRDINETVKDWVNFISEISVVKHGQKA